MSTNHFHHTKHKISVLKRISKVEMTGNYSWASKRCGSPVTVTDNLPGSRVNSRFTGGVSARVADGLGGLRAGAIDAVAVPSFSSDTRDSISRYGMSSSSSHKIFTQKNILFARHSQISVSFK